MALQARHWRPNGRVNSRLEQASERPPWIFRGEEKKGPVNRSAVVLLQEALMAVNCSIPAGATGVYGDQTAAAVRALQADPLNNLTPDAGIAGKDVLRVLDQKLLAREVGSQPVPSYWLTSEQYAALIAEVRSRYHNSPYRLEDGATLQGLVRRDYPGFAGVHYTVSFDWIRQTYLPPDWQGLPDWRETVRQNEQPGYRQGVNAAFEFPAPPTDPAVAQILADLDTLRLSPIAALVFIDLSARGVDRGEAMDWARCAAQAVDILMLTRRGMLATSRAEPLEEGRLPPPPPLPPPAPPQGLFGLTPAQVRRLLTEQYRRNPANRGR